ncbi:MAG: hypothetical protein K1X28_10440 [Parachlamydiales bacterium]|nr:hypothetical protein [Parachlamydiales bacterium]
MEVFCPWPEEFPTGRILLERNRHLTLAFLGDSNMPDLHSFPKPPFSIGHAGFFDKPLILAHVIAWHIHWLEDGLLDYQKQLIDWLKLKDRFLSHVTLARKPADEEGWKKAFSPLPLYVKNINLYESLGNSDYKIIWQHPIAAPFDEIEHTADIAFIVRGNLFLHAQLALAFHFPPMIRYFDFREVTDLNDIVTALNQILSRVDSEIGCPFKAVSFHGTKTASGEWEMIVDV